MLKIDKSKEFIGIFNVPTYSEKVAVASLQELSVGPKLLPTLFLGKSVLSTQVVIQLGVVER